LLLDNGVKTLGYNEPFLMKVLVQDANGMPVPGAMVQVENGGPQGLMLVSSLTTDANGAASFDYTATNIDKSSNLITIMVTASKDGYYPSRQSKVLDIDGSTTFLPPIPIIGNAFAGLPSWTSYVVLGGVAAVGAGVYLLRSPKAQENEDVIEDAATPQETAETTEESVEKTIDEEEDEEET
jgi:hypothetical protein